MLVNTSKLSTVLASHIPNHEKLNNKFNNAAKVCKNIVSRTKPRH
jgi:hypothetical protein